MTSLSDRLETLVDSVRRQTRGWIWVEGLALAALADSGQIEISATPHYHPLAPLLIDFATAVYAQAGVPEADARLVADTLVPGIPALSHADGRTARQIAATAWDVQALLTPALESATGGPITWSVAHDTTGARPFFVNYPKCGREPLELHIDPFGTYSDDGVPVVWVTQNAHHQAGRPMPAVHPLATHWITGRGDRLGPVFLIRDLELSELTALERHGYEELEFGRRIEILGRRKRDIVREVVETFVAFRGGKPITPRPPMARYLKSWVPKEALPPRLEPIDDQTPAIEDLRGVNGSGGGEGERD